MRPLSSGPQAGRAAWLAVAAPGLGCCSRDAKETPNARSAALRPGRVGPPGNPGGASGVASAGRGRAHEGHVGVDEPVRRGLLPAAPPRPGVRARGTAGGVPAPRRRHPQPSPGTLRAGQGRGQHPGPTPRGALLTGLLPGAWAPSRLRCGKPRRLCPGMAKGAGGGPRGFQTQAWAKDWDGQRSVGGPWGFEGTAPVAELRRLAPSWGHWSGRRAPSCALPYASPRTRAHGPGFHPPPAGLVPGARGVGKAALRGEGVVRD